ncbi:beta-N-acetylhexosaminidase [Photobacterium sp. MCCC 1A19761]|uniref:beta-N-acetylhexosaminidase n=1 Tax=Photobacterium sp. MCCC 1A19761 TaxID=3115000 RepID=UPI00307CCAB8
MSYRLDLTVISQHEQQSRFGLTLHNLSDQALENWSLHFTFARWIPVETLSAGQLEQLGSYCVLRPSQPETLAANGHFYTEFALETTPFLLHDQGIQDAFINTAPDAHPVQPLPVEITSLSLLEPPVEQLSIPLPPAKDISLIPLPDSLIRLNGEFRLNADVALSVPTALAAGCARWLQSELETLLHEDIQVAPQGQIRYYHDDTLTEGAYLLEVTPNTIWLRAGSAAGFTHATASLLQLIPTTPAHHVQASYLLPAVSISDQPNYHYRGMMVDCARHFHPVRRLKHLINQMARYKFNYLHWHLTDDEGWRLEIEAFPALTDIGAWRGPNEALKPQFLNINRRYGGYYTKAQVRELIAYAGDRGITLIPEIDIPGHCRAAIRSLPELLVDPEDRSKYRSMQCYPDNVLSPALPGTYTFLKTVLQEVCELFPGPYVHIGGDEVPEGAWSDCPTSQALMAQCGYRDRLELQGHILRFAEEVLRSHGKRMMGWEEATEGDKISKQTVVLSWRSEEAGLTSARAGFDVVMQPGQYTYLDMAQGFSADEPGANWAGSLPLDTVYSYRPLASLEADDPVHQHILGIQAGLWSEHITTQSRFEYMIYPRLLAIAELCWTRPELRHWQDFKARLSGQLRYLDQIGINYRRCELPLAAKKNHEKD